MCMKILQKMNLLISSKNVKKPLVKVAINLIWKSRSRNRRKKTISFNQRFQSCHHKRNKHVLPIFKNVLGWIRCFTATSLKCIGCKRWYTYIFSHRKIIETCLYLVLQKVVRNSTTKTVTSHTEMEDV